MANVDVELGDVPKNQDPFEFLLDCVEEGKNRGNQLAPSICVVPSALRDISPSSFVPRVVSIGPLHRKHKNVQEFEGQKTTYLHHLLHRLRLEPQHTLAECLQKVNDSLDDIRECYRGMKPYTDNELATMMVIDACFILDFLERQSRMKNKFLVSCIAIDLVLLENQIPFFILQEIFYCTILKINKEASLTSMLLDILDFIDPFQRESIGNVTMDTPHDHILGFMHKVYHDADAKSANFTKLPIVQSVVELSRAGVSFKPKKDENWAMEIIYKPSQFSCIYCPWGKPTLRMPQLHIDDDTELVLRNFIAYEQTLAVIPYYFSSYAAAMNLLVDTQEDVAKLVEAKVVVNKLGSNEEAAKLITSICKEVCIVDFFYGQQWKDLDSYYTGYWPKNIARLRRTYFSSPWNAIALLAGIILFALTVVQTVFTIKAT